MFTWGLNKRVFLGKLLLTALFCHSFAYAQTSVPAIEVPDPNAEAVVSAPRNLTGVNAEDSNIPHIPLSDFVDPSLLGTIEDPAFQNMTGRMYPMTPDQIKALRGVHEETQRAIATPPDIPPRPVVSSQNVPLSPGSVPPVVRLGQGYVTSVVFVDSTGAPWPISAYSIGDPGAFNIQWDTESNLLLIQGQGAYAFGNMAITLHGLNTPIMLTLVSEQQVVDYRVDFRVQGRGPNAQGSIIGSALPQNSSHTLMNLLDGVPPADAVSLEISGGPAQAWLQGSTLFLRTPLNVLSPSWQATMTSPDGTKVYQMNPTPLVLVSDRGRSTTLTIKGL